MEYFLILILIFLVTVFIDWKFKITYYRNWKQGILINIIFFVVGIIWDSWAVYRGHWIFTSGKTLGIKIGLLPVEEYLFFIIVPYFILTIYLLARKKRIGL